MINEMVMKVNASDMAIVMGRPDVVEVLLNAGSPKEIHDILKEVLGVEVNTTTLGIDHGSVKFDRMKGPAGGVRRVRRHAYQVWG